MFFLNTPDHQRKIIKCLFPYNNVLLKQNERIEMPYLSKRFPYNNVLLKLFNLGDCLPILFPYNNVLLKLEGRLHIHENEDIVMFPYNNVLLKQDDYREVFKIHEFPYNNVLLKH